MAIGQRRGFSSVDVHKINHLYGCDDVTATGAPGIIEHRTVPTDHVDPLRKTSISSKRTSPPAIQKKTLPIPAPTPEPREIDATEPGEEIEHHRFTDPPSVAISSGCVNRRNRLYCDLKRNMGWCRKSHTVAFEHCPLTCGTCDSRSAKKPPPVPPGELAPLGEIGHVNVTEISENEDCKGESCCDMWRNCFEFHCVLYSRFCAKTCRTCT